MTNDDDPHRSLSDRMRNPGPRPNNTKAGLIVVAMLCVTAVLVCWGAAYALTAVR